MQQVTVPMDDQNKNLILATALSFLVILVWFVLFPPPEPETPLTSGEIAQTAPSADLGTTPAAPVSTPTDVATDSETREAALNDAPRVQFRLNV